MAVEDDVREVSLEEGLENSPRPRPGPRVSVDQDESEEIPQAAQESPQGKAQEDLDILAPKARSREWSFGQNEYRRSYIQRELSVIGKAQWFSLLGEFMDKALSGDSAMSINSLMSAPTPRTPGRFSMTDFQDADMFIQAIGKLLVYTPEFLEKSVCIWLGVPDYEWDLMRSIMRESPDVGGMSDDQFEEIFATFIDQNYVSIDRFFRERFQRLRARWQARQKEANQSRSSKH